jgi:hypothetical protein
MERLWQKHIIPFWILDFRFWILKILPAGSFRSSSLASKKPNGIRV